MATIAEQLTSLANTKTAIKEAIVAKGVQVADTDPFSAYPAKIGQISGGGGEPVAKTKYGASIDNIIGDVNANGIPLFGELLSFVGTGIIELSGDYKFGYRFYATTWDRVYFPDLVRIGNGASTLSDAACCQSSFGYNRYTGGSVVVDMPKLESIDGNYVAQNMFSVGYVEEINLPKLQIIKGIQAAGRMFSSCKIKNVSLPSLTTISGQNAAQAMFTDCNIETVDLSALTTISGSTSCREMFKNNRNLIRADFPSLTTITDANALGSSSSNGMFSGCTGLLEIHFRADAQATIEGLSGYSSKFGATSSTIYFDL